MTVPVNTGSPFISNTTTGTLTVDPYVPLMLPTIICPTVTGVTFNNTVVVLVIDPLT